MDPVVVGDCVVDVVVVVVVCEVVIDEDVLHDVLERDQRGRVRHFRFRNAVRALFPDMISRLFSPRIYFRAGLAIFNFGHALFCLPCVEGDEIGIKGFGQDC